MTERNPPTPQEEMSQAGNTIVTIEHREWSGPLPDPEAVVEFDGVVSSGAERIFKEWETEADHRRAFEKVMLKTHVFERVSGRIFAFLLSLGALAAASYCASVSAYWPATVIGGAAVMPVALMFSSRKATNAP